MNRPFYAFGVLIAFLTLAMLAIGLSSRSSSVQPSAGGSGSGLPKRQPGVTLYVAVLPESEELELPGLAIVDDAPRGPFACGLASAGTEYAHGGGSDRAAGDVYQQPGLWRGNSLADAVQVIRTSIRSAIIEPAEPLRIDGFDQRLATGYDAAFDRAMAGESVEPQPARARSAQAEAVESVEIEDPMLLLFESLVRSEMPQPERKSNLAGLGARRWDYEFQAMVLGAKNRLWQGIVFARLDDEWLAAAKQTGLINPATSSSQRGLTWAEYIAWIGSKRWTVAWRDSQNSTGAAFWSEPNDELLQIAVAGLNRVAELIHELVAQWLDQAAERIAQRAAQLTAPASPK